MEKTCHGTVKRFFIRETLLKKTVTEKAGRKN